MPVNHNHEKLLKTTDRMTEKFLVAVGTIGVSNAAYLAPVRTGAFRNSIMYLTSAGSKGKASGSGVNQGIEIDGPDDVKTVRIGSAINYAEWVERKHGLFAASFHMIKGNLDSIAKRAFS